MANICRRNFVVDSEMPLPVMLNEMLMLVAVPECSSTNRWLQCLGMTLHQTAESSTLAFLAWQPFPRMLT